MSMNAYQHHNKRLLPLKLAYMRQGWDEPNSPTIRSDTPLDAHSVPSLVAVMEEWVHSLV